MATLYPLVLVNHERYYSGHQMLCRGYAHAGESCDSLWIVIVVAVNLAMCDWRLEAIHSGCGHCGSVALVEVHCMQIHYWNISTNEEDIIYSPRSRRTFQLVLPHLSISFQEALEATEPLRTGVLPTWRPCWHAISPLKRLLLCDPLGRKESVPWRIGTLQQFDIVQCQHFQLAN